MDNPVSPSMTDLANAAFRQAAKNVVRRAIETQTPIIIYRDGAIVKLDPVTMQPINESPAHDLQQPPT